MTEKRPAGTRSRRLPAHLRREQIAIAARLVFAENGLAGAKTRQIADAAQVTETVLYRHFDSKQAIFDAAVLQPLERLTTDLLRLTAEFAALDPHRRLQRTREVHHEVFAVLKEITPLLGVALFSGQTESAAFYRMRLRPVIDLAADAMRQAMSSRQQQVMEPRTMFLVLAGMYLGLAIDASLGRRALDEDAAVNQLTDLVAFGLLAPPSSSRGRAATGRRAAPRLSRSERSASRPKSSKSTIWPATSSIEDASSA